MVDPSSSVEATARGGSESSREEQPQPRASRPPSLQKIKIKASPVDERELTTDLV